MSALQVGPQSRRHPRRTCRIQFADGHLAEAPIALAEVQGYAHDAALRGAQLLEHFDRPGAQSWRDWATRLRARFRASFWLEDAHGRYPAVALDGGNVPVDGPASNMGHLLATGLLDAGESELVARQLAHPRLASGWGLRTLATSGHVATASSLLRGLIDAPPSSPTGFRSSSAASPGRTSRSPCPTRRPAGRRRGPPAVHG